MRKHYYNILYLTYGDRTMYLYDSQQVRVVQRRETTIIVRVWHKREKP